MNSRSQSFVLRAMDTTTTLGTMLFDSNVFHDIDTTYPGAAFRTLGNTNNLKQVSITFTKNWFTNVKASKKALKQSKTSR
jgi:hypothetical protein